MNKYMIKNNKIKICIPISNRSEYSYLRNILFEMENRKTDIDYKIVITGSAAGTKMDLKKNLKEDNFEWDLEIATEDMEKTIAISKIIKEFSTFLDKYKPHFIILLGDRYECYAEATTAFYKEIPIVHLHGGDITSGLHHDEQARHAITKLSSLHFPATEGAAQRIIQMRENPKWVFPFGSTSIDTLNYLDLPDLKTLSLIVNMELEKGYILIAQHPVSLESEDAGAQMKNTLETAAKFNMNTIITSPCIEKGYEDMKREIDRAVEEHSNFKFFATFPHEVFLSLMKNASVFIGNSSSGIIEAGHFETPVVNIGPREGKEGEFGRERGMNVIDSDNSKEDIQEKMKIAMSTGFKDKIRDMVHPYGKGNASKQIVEKIIKIGQNVPRNTLLSKK